MTLHAYIDYASLVASSSEKTRVAEQAALEHVYLGATMMNQAFPSVEQASVEVLWQFHDIEPGKGAREIRRMVGLLSGIRGGRVERDSCNEWKKECSWRDVEDAKAMVRLEFGSSPFRPVQKTISK
jgi:hypothetical protein